MSFKISELTQLRSLCRLRPGTGHWRPRVASSWLPLHLGHGLWPCYCYCRGWRLPASPRWHNELPRIPLCVTEHGIRHGIPILVLSRYPGALRDHGSWIGYWILGSEWIGQHRGMDHRHDDSYHCPELHARASIRRVRVLVRGRQNHHLGWSFDGFFHSLLG